MRSRNWKYNHSKALNLLVMLVILSIAACTGPSRPNKDALQPDNGKETTTSPALDNEKASLPLTSVSAIQKAYADIAAKLEHGDLDSTAFKYDCHGEKNGTISYFTEKGKLRLVIHRYNEYDHYSVVDRYYVRDSTMFFAHTNSVTWAFDGGLEGSTKNNIKEKRIYLVDGKPIKCLEKKFIVLSAAADNPSSESVPNREVDCPSIEAVLKPYRLLSKYRGKPTSDCLE
jgi:hypothetical protein